MLVELLLSRCAVAVLGRLQLRQASDNNVRLQCILSPFLSYFKSDVQPAAACTTHVFVTNCAVHLDICLRICI